MAMERHREAHQRRGDPGSLQTLEFVLLDCFAELAMTGRINAQTEKAL